jgi:hypothetical protein
LRDSSPRFLLARTSSGEPGRTHRPTRRDDEPPVAHRDQSFVPSLHEAIRPFIPDSLPRRAPQRSPQDCEPVPGRVYTGHRTGEILQFNGRHGDIGGENVARPLCFDTSRLYGRLTRTADLSQLILSHLATEEGLEWYRSLPSEVLVAVCRAARKTLTA